MRARFAALVLAAGALVFLGGWVLARGAAGAVAVGVAVGCAFQLLLFGVASVAFPGQRLAAYGVGLLGRLVLLVAALLFVPTTGLPVGPTLFSLVAVLFATTLLEPVLFAAGARKLG
ncbi:MAG TPA: hypothetical protein VFX98_16580 [Longimicrobiaceae bacterium]|nr:hypothetical protein [Longimicrobiaceae bacterium]